MKNILVLGATSGIAKALIYKFAKEGYNLIISGRNIEEIDKMANDIKLRFLVDISTKYFDALNYEEHQNFVDSCINEYKVIDGVILAFGYLTDQKNAEVNFEQAKKIIEINFTSCVSILNVFANYFESLGRGFICAISSVAGERGRQSNYLYGAAKGGLSIYLQGLRNRLFKRGITVLTVKPGFVDTKMTYGNQGMFLVAKTDKVANDIYNAILKSKDVLYTPFFWYWIMFIIKLVPEKLFKKLKL